MLRNACDHSVIETELPDTSTYRGRGVPPGGVKVRCSLDLADEFTCAWPSLLLRHGAPSGGGTRGGDADGDEDEGGAGGDRGEVEKWRVSAGFGGLVLSKVASGEGAAADSSPFLRCEKDQGVCCGVGASAPAAVFGPTEDGVGSDVVGWIVPRGCVIPLGPFLSLSLLHNREI